MAARSLVVAKLRFGLGLLSLTFAIACSSAGESGAAQRKALIITNGEYAHITKLINPENDGRLIEAKLNATGFDVRFERNLTGTRISQVVHEFARSLTPETEAVVYYAGHGIQFAGNSLMVGVDATLSSGEALVRETHGLLELTALLEMRAGIALLFWDACRDNPLPTDQRLQLLTDGGSLSLHAGAAQWPERRTAGNSIVFFATYPGMVAKDGSGSNSPFAAALARHIETPNQPISEFLARVAADVRRQTNGAQLPQVVSGQPDRDFVFLTVGTNNIAQMRDYEDEIRKLRKQVELLDKQVNLTRRIRVVSVDNAAAIQPAVRPPNGAGEDRRPAKEGAKEKWEAVEILFGTSRKLVTTRAINGPERVAFSGNDADSLTLGKTLVTVPRNRARGTVSRPTIGIGGVFEIQFRSADPAWDFTIQRVSLVDADAFVNDIDGRVGASIRYKGQVLVFVHGYNTSFDDAMYRTAQIAHDLDFDGVLVAFSWPSYGSAWGYLHDTRTVETSGRWLHDMLVLIAQRTQARTINVIAHSMGNRAVLSALNRAAVARTGLNLNELVLAAPDIGRTEFLHKAELIQQFVKGATLYASSNDKALALSRRLSVEVAGHVPPPPDAPIVAVGVDTIDVSEADTSMFFTNHTTFAERGHLIRDIQLLLTGGKRPPDARNPFFLPRKAQERVYWRYVSN